MNRKPPSGRKQKIAPSLVQKMPEMKKGKSILTTQLKWNPAKKPKEFSSDRGVFALK